MQDPGLPPRPGEPVPGEVGKKGGDMPERPEAPVDLPGKKPEVEPGSPQNVPTI